MFPGTLMAGQEKTRYLAHFSGHVQGVGFRYTTEQLAQGCEVTGYVENLPDGRVRLVVEGACQELEQLLTAIDRRLGHWIRTRQLDRQAATGEFARFTIRR